MVGEEALWRGAAAAVHRAVVRARGGGGLAQCAEQEGEGGEEGAGGLAAHEQHTVALGERAGVVARLPGHPAGALEPFVRALRLLAAPLEAEDFDPEGLLGVAEGEGAAVGGGRRAALVRRAMAEGAADDHRRVALELVAVGGEREADGVGDVAVVDVGVAPAGLLLGDAGAVAAVAELDGARDLGGGGEGGDGGEGGAEAVVVAVGGVGGVDEVVAESHVLSDHLAASNRLVECGLEAGEVQADAALADGDEGGGGGDGVVDGVVGQTCEPGARALL